MNPIDQLRDRYGMNNDEVLQMIKDEEETPENMLINAEIDDLNQRIQASLKTKQKYDEDSFNHKRAVIRLNCYHLFKKKLKRIKQELEGEA